MQRVGYINKRSPTSTDAKPVFTWGARAHAEFGELSISDFIGDVYAARDGSASASRKRTKEVIDRATGGDLTDAFGKTQSGQSEKT